MDTGVSDRSEGEPRRGVQTTGDPAEAPTAAVAPAVASGNGQSPTSPGAARAAASYPLPPVPAPQRGAAASIDRPAPREDTGRPRGRLRRRRKILLGVVIAALILLPAVGAAVWSSRQPSTYAAEVDLLHQPSDTSATDTIDRQLATHQVLLLRRDLLDDVAESVGRDPDELADDVGVEIVEGSSVLRIRVVDENRDRARRAATTLADRYAAIAGRLAPTSNIGRVELVDSATVLGEPVGPEPLRAAAAGGLAGLVLVLAFLALLRLRDRPGGPAGP